MCSWLFSKASLKYNLWVWQAHHIEVGANPIWNISYLQKVGKAVLNFCKWNNSGKTLLNVFQINSLDFNANETNRKGTCERITVKSEVIFHLGLISKVGQTAKRSTIDTSVSAVKRWIILKIVFSFLNFWSVKLALVCWTVEECQGHTRIIHDKSNRADESVLNSRITSRRERKQGVNHLWCSLKGRGVNGWIHEGRQVYTEHWMPCVNPHETPETGTPHNVYTLIYTFCYKEKTPLQLCNCVNCDINQSPEFGR